MSGIRERILDGEVMLGTWLSMGNAISAEVMGNIGFDWALIDLEHGVGTLSDVLPQLQAMTSSPTVPMVRIPNHDTSTILKVLDLGAQGIMVPQIDDFNQAKQLSEALFYPPKGSRGKAPSVRATKYGSSPAYLANANSQLVCMLQVETESILEDLDKVASLETVDVLFIGPVDLTSSLGIPGQYDHPRFLKAIDRVLDAAEKSRKATGIILFDHQDLEKYVGLGINVIAAGSDIGLMDEAGRALLSSLKSRL